MATQATAHAIRFGEYELDFRSSELRRNGALLKLQPQPAKVLVILASRAGQVVTRQELAEQVWGSETYVDFEHGLNYAIRQIRSVLEDNAENPRYLETVPKRGYRFIATISGPAEIAGASSAGSLVARNEGPHRFVSMSLVAAAALAVAIVGAIYAWPRTRASRPPILSLAVLPLHNLSGDSKQDYFSDGMTDELTTELAKMTKLRVISHTSVERYKDTKRPLQEIARELAVDAVLEGTVLSSGDRVRITAQLIDARSDQHLWAESYERDLRDVLGLQSEVARQISREIGVNLAGPEQSGSAGNRRTVDPPAHDAYLQGAFYLDQMSCRDFESAVVYFEKAVAKDPNFAPAYSGLAETYFTIADWSCWHDDPFDKAEAAAKTALELEPGDAHAHAVLAEIGFSRDWNWIGPAEQFTTAIDLDPNDPGIHSYYGMYLVSRGKVEQGLAEERKAQVLDPFSERTNLMHTWTLYLAHHFDEAIEHANRALRYSPSYGEYYWLGQCYERKGMPDQAIEFYLKTFAGEPRGLPLRRAAYKQGGLPEYWQEDERLRRQRKEKVNAVYQAMYYAHRGNIEKALEQLELAYQQHSDGLQFLKAEPVYDSLRDEPRFKQLLARLGLQD